MVWVYRVFQAIYSAGFEYRDHSALRSPENLHTLGWIENTGKNQIAFMGWGKQIVSERVSL